MCGVWHGYECNFSTWFFVARALSHVYHQLNPSLPSTTHNKVSNFIFSHTSNPSPFEVFDLFSFLLIREREHYKMHYNLY